MSSQGMNVQQTRDLASAFHRSSGQLEAIHREIDQALHRGAWIGDDADRMRHEWSTTHRALLQNAATFTEEASQALQRHADDQDEASGVDRGGGVQDWLRDRWDDGVEWAGDRWDDGVGWTGDRIEDGRELAHGVWEDATAHLGAFGSGAERALDVWGGLGLQFIRSLWTGEPPQVSEVVAGGIIALGSTGGAIANLVSGTDYHILDDGRPVVGPVTDSARNITDLELIRQVETDQITGVSNFSEFSEHALHAYDNSGDGQGARVEVTAIRQPGEPTRYLVSIPGTQSPGLGDPGSWRAGVDPHDWQANVHAMANGSSTYSEGVTQAIMDAVRHDQAAHGETGLHPNLMLTGHSQGGLVAANIAASDQLQDFATINGVASYGSPVECADVPSNIPVLSVENGEFRGLHTAGDVIPMLDVEGVRLDGSADSPPSVTTVHLPHNVGSGDVVPHLDPYVNHDLWAYREHVREAMESFVPTGSQQADRQMIADWEQAHGLQDYYAGTAPTNTYEVYVTREVD